MVDATHWNNLSAARITAFSEGRRDVDRGVHRRRGNTTSSTKAITVDTVADAAPTTTWVINDGDGYRNAEKAAVSYTLAGIDASTTATVTFTSSGGGSLAVVSGATERTRSTRRAWATANPPGAGVTDTAGNTASGTGDTSVGDTVAGAAPTTTVVINDGDGFINNAEKAGWATHGPASTRARPRR